MAVNSRKSRRSCTTASSTPASQNRLFAADAVTGTLLWRYDHEQPKDLLICCGPVNRGAAIMSDNILMATLDARLIAFDRKSGKIVWNTEIAPYDRGLSATSAPLVVGDIAVIGIAGGEYGVRGFFDGYDVKTGERRWRLHRAGRRRAGGRKPGPAIPGRAAATAWVTGSYDPTTNTLLWAAGNPSPSWNRAAARATTCTATRTLAVDPDTGKSQYHFQFTPNDVWDYDGNELFLVDVDRGGQRCPRWRRRIATATLPARSARRQVPVRQAVRRSGQLWEGRQGAGVSGPQDGAGRRGRPAQRICPGLAGGKQGSFNGAFNPDLGLAFLPVIESCMQFKKGIVIFLEGVPFSGGEPIGVDAADGKAYGHLSTIDVATGEEKWRYKDPYPMMAGCCRPPAAPSSPATWKATSWASTPPPGRRPGAGGPARPFAATRSPISSTDAPSSRSVWAAAAASKGIVGKPSIVPDAGLLVVFELKAGSG